MIRRLGTILAAVALLSALIGLPATAHSVSYTLGEQGTLDCGNPTHQPAYTYIYAQAHHKHKVGGSSIYVHYAADGAWRFSQGNWEVTAASFWLSRQSGWGFSTSSSYGSCA